MKNVLIISILSLILLSQSCNSTSKTTTTAVSPTNKKGIELIANPSNKKVEVFMDGQLFTAYCYPENIAKPVLYPLITASGTRLTRGFPLEPVAGERVDHPHHVGVWLNYGDVNGLDFWNNSEAIPAEKKKNYGTIYHQDIVAAKSGTDKGELRVKAVWKTNEGKALLNEATTFVFTQSGSTRAIERTTTLIAIDQEVNFKDNKEGMIGIRVTRAMEIPSKEPAIFTDAQGNPTEVKALSNEGVKGNYISSEGKEGDAVWATRGKWVQLQSEINGEPVAIAILDHPKNVGYPTYWHARGYGLFAANPLGQAIFSEGKEALNFKLKAGESITFRYKILVHSGSKWSKTDLDNAFAAFSK